MEKTAIVTGGSSGIGLWTARALRSAGCIVYEFSRREVTHEDGIRHISVDVTDENGVKAAVEQVARETGRLDILVCNAGFGISGAAEFTENKDAKRLLEVNLFGVVNCVKAAVPLMRQQGSGRIVCLSSVAGAIAIPFQSWYSLSKAAVSSYVNALREELRPFGISVCAILPGDIHTGFTAAREKSPAGDDVYCGRIARSVAVMEKDEENGMDPQKAGDFIARIALKKRVKPAYAIGFAYSCAVMASRLLPGRLVSRIVGLIYAG